MCQLQCKPQIMRAVMICCVLLSFSKHSSLNYRVTSLAQWVDTHRPHYNDVIMSAMASQITSLTIVYSIVYSGTDERKHPVTSEFPAQRASNAGNISIWWRHHANEANRENMGKSVTLIHQNWWHNQNKTTLVWAYFMGYIRETESCHDANFVVTYGTGGWLPLTTKWA